MKPTQRQARGPRGPLTVRRLLRADRGQGILEFALVIPMLLFLFFGVFEFGRYYSTRLALRHSVREATRFAVTGNVLQDSTGENMTRGRSIQTIIAQSAPHLNINPSDVFITPADGGGPEDIVRVDVRHGFRLVIPIIADMFPTAVLEIRVSSVMKNEAF